MIQSQTYCPCFSAYENAVGFYVFYTPQINTLAVTFALVAEPFLRKSGTVYA
jgi:hypothetical protein